MRYAQLEAVLARQIGVLPGKRPRFQARLKQLQRMGFPEGVNAGKSAKADYNVDHFFQLAAVLELLQMGLTPERSISALRTWWPYHFRKGLLVARVTSHLVGIILAPKDFGGLASAGEVGEDDKIAWSSNSASLMIVDVNDRLDLPATAREILLRSPRSIVLNLTFLMQEMIKGFAENNLDQILIDETLRRWSKESDVFGRVIGEGLPEL